MADTDPSSGHAGCTCRVCNSNPRDSDSAAELKSEGLGACTAPPALSVSHGERSVVGMRIQSLAIVGVLFVVVGTAPRAARGASVYFVAVDGNDDRPGSDTQPWHSIGHAAVRAQAGDLVVVRPGTYSEAVVLARSGDTDAPIVFRGLPGAVLSSPDPTKSLSAFDIAAGTSYVELQGFDLGSGFDETVFVRPGAHHIVLSGLHVHDNHTGIWIDGASDVVLRDSVVEHNYRTGVRLFGGARRIQILDTRSEANDDGLACAGDSDGFNADDSTADVSFERARAIGNSEDGFDLQTPSVTVSQASASDNGCSGMKVAAGALLENVLVEGNRTGINLNGAPGMTAVMQNCTIAQNDLGVRAMGDGYRLVMRNSVVSGPAKALSYAAAVDVREDHNLLYRPQLGDRLIVRMETSGDETLFSGNDVNNGRWQRESGQGQATIADDPRFESGGCVPGPDSSAVDSGDDSAFAPVDLAGTWRPVGNAPDRGAVERVPDTPALQVRRVGLRADGTGMGPLRLQARVILPPAPQFDPLRDTVSVTVRGARGAAFAATVPPSAWATPRSAGTLLFRDRTGGTGRRVRLRLVVDGRQASLSLTASRADVWTVDATPINVIVELGRLRATADVSLTAMRRVMTSP